VSFSNLARFSRHSVPAPPRLQCKNHYTEHGAVRKCWVPEIRACERRERERKPFFLLNCERARTGLNHDQLAIFRARQAEEEEKKKGGGTTTSTAIAVTVFVFAGGKGGGGRDYDDADDEDQDGPFFFHSSQPSSSRARVSFFFQTPATRPASA